jgi:hypothetical protein
VEQKCDKCGKLLYKLECRYKRGRIIKNDKIILLPGDLCGDCYDNLDDQEKRKWVFLRKISESDD